MTGRPLGVVTTPPTTLLTVVVPDVDIPINDLDNTVKRGPLGVMTGNETISTKCVTSFSFFFNPFPTVNKLTEFTKIIVSIVSKLRKQTCVSVLLTRRQNEMSASRSLNELRETRHRYSLDGIALLDRDSLRRQSLNAISNASVSHCDPLSVCRCCCGRCHGGTLRIVSQCCDRNSYFIIKICILYFYIQFI